MAVGAIEVAQRSNHQVHVLDAVVLDKRHQIAQHLQRCIQVQLGFAFGLVELLVDVFQHADEQVFLAAEIVIKHAVVGVGCLGNTVDTLFAPVL